MLETFLAVMTWKMAVYIAILLGLAWRLSVIGERLAVAGERIEFLERELTRREMAIRDLDTSTQVYKARAQNIQKQFDEAIRIMADNNAAWAAKMAKIEDQQVPVDPGGAFKWMVDRASSMDS